MSRSCRAQPGSSYVPREACDCSVEGQLAESKMEEVVVGIKARHSCLRASQRLLRCVLARSTGDPTGVYPQLCKLQTSIIFSPRATAWAPPPLIPHTSVSRVRQKENFANLGRGVIFSSGDGGPLHSVSPHPLPATLPMLLLAGLDRQTTDLGPSASVGSRKLHKACSGRPCLPFIPYVSGGSTGYCTHNALKQPPRDLEGGQCCPNCSLGGLCPGSQVH